MPVTWLGEIGFIPYQPGTRPAPGRISSLIKGSKVRAVGRRKTAPSKGSPSGYSQAREAYEETGEKLKQRTPAVLAEQIMSTPVMTLTPDAPLSEAWKVLREKKVHHVPVVSGEGHAVGILSDRDLLRGRPNAARRDARVDTADPPTLVRHLMSNILLTATPDTEIREIARVIVDERIGCLPILDPSRRLQGILTSTDILRCVVNHAPLDLWI